jgi:hypothetical protein
MLLGRQADIWLFELRFTSRCNICRALTVSKQAGASLNYTLTKHFYVTFCVRP